MPCQPAARISHLRSRLLPGKLTQHNPASSNTSYTALRALHNSTRSSYFVLLNASRSGCVISSDHQHQQPGPALCLRPSASLASISGSVSIGTERPCETYKHCFIVGKMDAKVGVDPQSQLISSNVMGGFAVNVCGSDMSLVTASSSRTRFTRPWRRKCPD